MKVALVASSYLPRPGGLERHVHELASGLTRRGVEVEVLTQDPPRPMPPVSEFEGFVVRRFGGSRGNGHLGVASGLWEHLRRRAKSFDLVDLHFAHAPLGLAVVRARPPTIVMTLHVAVDRLLRWPATRVSRVLVDHAAQVVCATAVERELLCRSFPAAVGRTSVIPPGVDVAGIAAARPFAFPGHVIVTIDRLEPPKRVDRAIAAMAALGSSFRLAVIGDGPSRQKLIAYATDLRVSARVELMGHLPDAELYRWLRTSSVVLALAQEKSSTLQVAEAICAGSPVVASDIAVHREAAWHLGEPLVKLVAPHGSPLEIADRVAEAAELSVPAGLPPTAWTWDDVVEETLVIYETALERTPEMSIVRS
ncbi:MAG: glycosyltransferase family 4 protein [Solirubrobacteraceae bacterium]